MSKTSLRLNGLWLSAAACLLIGGCGGNDSAPAPAPAPVPAPAPAPTPAPAPAPAPTGILSITINPTTAAVQPSEKPTFGGTTFGPVGAYERLVGTAKGALDPNDSHNTGITDLKLAPRNASGLVEYSMDFYILKPVDPSKGNRKVFFELPNRGGKQFGRFNGSAGGNNPATAAHAGNAFLMKQGYTLVWAAWEASAPRTNYSMGVTTPVAVNADGSPITGPSYEYITFGNGTSTSYQTAYETSTTDTTKATLTVRSLLTDAPVTVPPTGWTWTSPDTIGLLPAGTSFQQDAIYELSFTAKNPVVSGIGFAAMRDFTSFLRNASVDTAGTPNPLASSNITRYVTWTLSQPARFMNDFVWLGFNQDLKGKKVFDGVFNWVGAGTGIALNTRFSQSGRTERNRQNHRYPEGPFPFAYPTLTDPFTGKTDGRNKRCMETSTCPKIMNVNSANEYWVKTGSLLHTDLAGNDLPDPANVRNYLISGTQHASPAGANSLGMCEQFGNSVDQNPALRALWVAMDEWLDGVEPPPSAVPQRSRGTAAFISPTPATAALSIGNVAKSDLGWPSIPKVLYTGLATIRNLLDFGPQTDQGIITINPPTATGKIYPAFVSTVDSDGNEMAGIRLPPVSVPVATTTGWSLRATSRGGPDGCEGTGTLVPFAPDEAARTALADPRPSLTARYGNHAGYVSSVTAAAHALASQRLLLPEDVKAYISAAQQPVSVVNNPVYGSYSW